MPMNPFGMVSVRHYIAINKVLNINSADSTSKQISTSAKPGKALWVYGSCIVLKRTEVTMGCLCRSV